MLMRRFTDFILRGRYQAMVTAFAVSFVPVLGLLGSLIATLVTLRKGVQDGALVFIAAVLPIVLIYESVPPDQGATTTISTVDVVIMVILINIGAWLAAVILRRTSSWSLVLDVIGLLGFAVVVILHLIYPDMASWWQQWLTNYFNGVSQATTGDPHALASITNMANNLKDYATGITAIMLSFYALLDLVLARWWQDAMFNPGGLRRELLSIRLSKFCGIVCVAGLAAAFMQIVSLQDATLILGMTYSLAGLSLMHYAIAATHAKWYWLMIIYIALSIIPQSLILIALAGLLDTAFDFRKRLPALTF
jgi:hypothetical protein